MRSAIFLSFRNTPQEYSPLDLLFEELEYDWERGDWVVPHNWKELNDNDSN